MDDCGDMVTMKNKISPENPLKQEKGRTVVENVVVTSAIQDLFSIDRNMFYSCLLYTSDAADE